MSETNYKNYCLRCKSSQEIKDSHIIASKNNRRMLIGNCIQCGTKTSRFLKKETSKLDEIVKEDDKVENVKELIQHIENKIVKKVKGNKNKNKEILVE